MSQNLVPNPSFEIIDSCPTSLNNLENAIGWKTILNTPDCFNRCANGVTAIPNNLAGFQEPLYLSDNSYAGLVPAGFDNGGYREMIGISFTSPLEVGRRYYFSFNYSSGFKDLTTSHCNCFTSHFGMKMLTNFTDTVNLGRSLINDTAILYTSFVLSDTLNWNLFKWDFTADSTYTFIVIGNFFRTAILVSTCQDSSRSFSYIYIDNICLSPIKNDCFEQNHLTEIDEFLVYPNVGNGLIKIESKLTNDFFQFQVYDCLGKLIKNEKMKGGLSEIDLQDFSKGMYLLRIENLIYKIIII